MTGKRIAIICLVLLALAAVYVVTRPPKPVRAADLLAERSQVQCRHPGETVKEVSVGQHESVGTGDKINTNQTGLGILTFADFLRVEVFRKTELQVKATPDPNAPLIVKLYLALGTTLQGLQRKAGQRVDVTTETDWATIRAVSTTYLISVDDDEVTWVVVFDGEVEVEAQGQTVIVRAGQAMWVEPGQPPHAPIDVDLGTVDEWVEKLRGTGEVGPLRPVVVPPEEEDETDPWLEVGHSPSEPNEGQLVTVVAEAGDDETGLDRIEIQMPGQPLVTCWESPCEATGGPYPEGEFDYEVRIFDEAGNVANQAGSITVSAFRPEDGTDPWLEVGHWPEEPGETQEVTVSAKAGDEESELDRIEIQMPGQPLVICWESNCEATGGPYPQGEYGYEVAAFDAAGNVAYRKGYFAVAATALPSAARFSLLIGGELFNDERVQNALGFGIDWGALRDEIGEVVLVDFFSGKTLAGPTGPAYDPEQARALLEKVGYYGFDTALLFDPEDELAAGLAEWVASYLYDVGIYPEFVGVAPADARIKLATMIEAGESGLLVVRR